MTPKSQEVGPPCSRGPVRPIGSGDRFAERFRRPVPPTERRRNTLAYDIGRASSSARCCRRFVVLSGRGVEVFGDSFEPSMAEAERVVREAGVDWTVIRPNNFSQNFDEDIFAAPLLEGRLALPVGDVPEPFIDVDDIADVAAALLTEGGHTGKVYELSGPRALSFAEAVAELAEASGRPMRFEDITPDEYVAELTAADVPADLARALADVLAWLTDGCNATPVSGVRDVLGREPRDFSVYAKAAAKAKAWD